MDVYLADLRKLATPFGGAIDRILGCAFLAGLPDDARRLLRASVRLNELGLDELLARARNILKDDTEPVSAAVEAPEPPREGPKMLQMWWTQPLLKGLLKPEQYKGHT